jgi:hypothetical protein
MLQGEKDPRPIELDVHQSDDDDFVEALLQQSIVVEETENQRTVDDEPLFKMPR